MLDQASLLLLLVLGGDKGFCLRFLNNGLQSMCLSGTYSYSQVLSGGAASVIESWGRTVQVQS